MAEVDEEVLEHGNNAMKTFSDSMTGNFKRAIDLYKQSVREKYPGVPLDDKPWVLFVVDEKERNVIDQKVIETELQRLHGIPSMRCTLAQINALMVFNEDTHILKIRGKEIGFVYYRSGY